MEVNGPGAQLAAAGHTHIGLAGAGQNGPQKDDRGAHLPHERVGHIRAAQAGRVYGHGGALPRHPAAQMAQNGDRSLHIAEAGAVVQDADSVGQRGGAEQGQDAVFRAVDHHLARQTPPAVDLVIFHGTSSDFRTFAPSYAEEVQGCEYGRLYFISVSPVRTASRRCARWRRRWPFPAEPSAFSPAPPGRPAGAARCHRADRRRRPSPASAPPRPCR